MTLKEKVTDLCKEKNLSVRELERRAGLKQRTIQHWDESEPSGTKLLAVALVLDVPIEELLSVYEPSLENIAYIETMKNKKSATQGDGIDSISDKDKKFITWFRSLSPEKQQAILISQDAPKDLF